MSRWICENNMFYWRLQLRVWSSCLNAQCHLFCRFHYASKKKTSARLRAQMFSRSNYPLNDPLKATEREESSASSRPELLIHHPNITSHQEEEGGAERGEGEETTLRDFLLILLFLFKWKGCVVLRRKDDTRTASCSKLKICHFWQKQKTHVHQRFSKAPV